MLPAWFKYPFLRFNTHINIPEKKRKKMDRAIMP
jgi:hypothetical protein